MNTDITTFILAGGKSSRFGSDKARADITGEPILSRLARVTHGLNTNVIVSSDTGARYSDLNIAEIADITPGFGPLSGLQSILTRLATNKALILTCDMPLVSIKILQRLISEYHDDHLACVFGVRDTIFPFPGIYHKKILPHVEKKLNRNELSVCSLLASLPTKIVEPVPDEIFFNMNTKEDYLKLNGDKNEIDNNPYE